MKGSDFIIRFLIEKGITDIFGYPGGVITHFIDSACKFPAQITAHTAYHEQGAAYEACGYAQTSGRAAAAYATSGPGATNLISGIANAYFDGLPVLFFTGQVDTYAGRGDRQIRQCGFQETDIVSMTTPITKYSVYVESTQKLPEYLETAYRIATSGRPGPALLDLPADVQRADIPDELAARYLSEREPEPTACCDSVAEHILHSILQAQRPCIIAGAGVGQSGMKDAFRRLAAKLGIPVVTSLNAFDVLPFSSTLQLGFIGANGHRCANLALAKSDFIVSLGSRLDLKQVGNRRAGILSQARLLRVDIDAGELEYSVQEDEEKIPADLRVLLPALEVQAPECSEKFQAWRTACAQMKSLLYAFDYAEPHRMIDYLSRLIPDETQIVTDCGQHQLWAAQAFKLKSHQAFLTTGGLGAMGYALPACIGAHYATGKSVVGFAGDGGFQMNIQELQFLSREQVPVKIVVLNNHALGMIRHFQEMNFDKRYAQTTESSGYTVPAFSKIAQAYGLDYACLTSPEQADAINWQDGRPGIIEVILPNETYLLPRFGKNNGFSDAEPRLPEALEAQIEKLTF